MIELPNSTLIGKGFGCLVIKCEGDEELEVGGEGARAERWGETGNEDREERRERRERKEGRVT